MLQMSKGCKVPHPEKLEAGFEVLGDNMLNANVDADMLADVLLDFVKLHADEPVYFFLELPPESRSALQVSYGQNIVGEDNETYYLDDLNLERVQEIMAKVGNLLIQDGICRFGFGGNYSNDHIIADKYNVLSVFSMDLEPVKELFLQRGIPQVEELLTAWDTFSEEEPGIATRYEENDMDVFSIPSLYAPRGMYLLSIRPDE